MTSNPTPSFDEGAKAVPEERSPYLFRAQTELLAAWGHWLDLLAVELNPAPRVESPSEHDLEIVDVKAMALEQGFHEDVEWIEREAAKRGAATSSVRFNIARVLADDLIDKFRATADDEKQENICAAIQEFERANRLEKNAVDILAAAILMPNPEFDEVCTRYKHQQWYLALLYDVPIGAVALRQKIVHFPKELFRVPDLPKLDVA